MENFRFDALKITLSRKPYKVSPPSKRVPDYFGEMTFNKKAMREFLSQEAFGKVISAVEKGERIERKIADQVASAMKAWAISKGATHYTHWFHPLTGATAEKHDAFVDPADEGRAIDSFRGAELEQQEPDASSFPSGGIRNTFEARGYTAWDPTSPAFIMDGTLCIPTIFVSYTGEALDYKTPLLKTLSAIDKAAVDVCRYFDRNVKKVIATLGWEQEYFLIDSALYTARPDLVLTGRTVFGHASAKDQQLSDHYFGTIQERVMDFMRNFEYEAYRLGIPIKTRHNEVAPNQFECAPVFEEANLAVDHNQLLMHLMKRVAKNHNFNVLLHEKPFAKVNGSGKHNNWSLQTDKGENLLSPGKTPKENLRFLTFFVNTLKALHTHSDLLRASIASSGNEHRLGGNEAPPAIISAFIGSQITNTLNQIEKTGHIVNDTDDGMNLSIPKIPEILRDNTDRNRTSPFAFTGNKFELRAVGSSATCANPMTALNIMVAEQLRTFKHDVDMLIRKKVNKKEAIAKVLVKYVKESRPIRFEGNNYSKEWIAEAEKRGLPNINSTPEALRAYLSDKNVKLFKRHNVLNRKELLARYNIRLENYTKQLQIESRVIGDLATNHIIPVAIRYQNLLIDNARGLKEVLDHKTYVKLSKNQITSLKEISEHITQVKTNVEAMKDERRKANRMESTDEMARAYYDNVRPYLEIIRYHVDKLELMVDDTLWPMPKYRELLFIK
ncbi:MAG: glutamine synthetase III [Bacteroidales bacterium]|nr:glutamine synthetase III [Bacteroidales bacterium]